MNRLRQPYGNVAPKKNFGSAAVQRAIRLAILSWNMGCQGLVAKVLLKMSTEPKTFTKAAILATDKRRLSDAVRSGTKEKDCALLRNLLVVTICQEVI